MEFLFIDEDGSLSVADHIPDEMMKCHEAGVAQIFNTAYGAVLNASNDWEEIKAIPSRPLLGNGNIGEMLPCPFDGGKPFYSLDRQYDDKHVIECEDCGLQRREEHSKEDAIEAWNTRHR